MMLKDNSIAETKRKISNAVRAVTRRALSCPVRPDGIPVVHENPSVQIDS